MSFQQIQAYLNGELSDLAPEDLGETCQQRLLTALQSTGRYAPGTGDTIALVRHMLRREAELQRGNSPQLKMPRRLPYPRQRQIWEQGSMDILIEDDRLFLLEARAWTPEWLPDSQIQSPEVPLFREDERRSYESVAGDPFLSYLGYETYQSAGQREAIRAILTAPPQATLVVNLPTGSGKSLCAHLPAWLDAQTGGVTIVVVPTVALAIDQERAFQEKTGISYSTAYYSDTSVEGQERREEIRDRIRQGTQRIVFTSPEGLLESLAGCVYEAAERQLLRYFVIDEAHIVEQWGDEFRPSFQELPGFRRDLLRLTSFRTLLLTATVTQSCLDTLRTLFGQPGSFQVVSSVQLRPEPAYWFAHCASAEERSQRLIEAMYNLPRPLIIYGSKVSQVKSLYKELKQAEFQRCAIMTGDSSTTERLQLIEDWRSRRIDAVVATSAFGLGVDLPDVRAVIHACIPETIDRFYQEVGRGGRDGLATLSLTLYTKADYEVAASLNERAYITIERGIERWQSMFGSKTALPTGRRYKVSIDVAPSYNIDLSSKQNRAWNIRTLTLMNRSNLIRLDAEPPPHRANFDSDEAYGEAIAQHHNQRVIEIIDQRHLELETWQTVVEPIRLQQQRWMYSNLDLMKEVLHSKRCISEIFSEAYSIPADVELSRGQIHVERSCGGCPVCRKQTIEPFAGVMPTPLASKIWKEPYFVIGEPLQKLLAGEKLLLVFCPSFNSQTQRRRNNLLQWFVKQGIRNIVSSDELRGMLRETAEAVGRLPVFLFEKYEPLQMPVVPTLIIHSSTSSFSPRYLVPPESQAPRIIMLPFDTPDPNATHRSLNSVYSGRHFSFEFLTAGLSLS